MLFLGYNSYIFFSNNNVTVLLDPDWKLRVHEVNGQQLYKLNWNEYCRLYKASLDQEHNLTTLEIDDPNIRSYFISSKL